ncbi:MAG: glycoside-pentoside-hexuronide (GPH):cation symporter [Eubacterium sp.]|nr:glycoside-pentoside-hexuronide (GPH):cation symporter [Eubacterium sp.]MDE6155891.1 glycoside-pentoside-hexuronide (GPH):cation symporter [Eubacterium sp.]
MSNSIRTYTAKERNMYLLGLAGQNMIYNIIGTGLYFYFQSVIFIPAIAISIFMAVARVWDAINDPMMGTIVDKTNTKWGKCRPYLLFVPPVILIITIATFLNGTYSSANAATQNVLIVGWAAASYILWGMVYTIGDIPLWGITSRMTEVEKDRASILSFARIAAGLGAGIVLLSITPVSQSVGQMLEEKVGSVAKSQQYGFIIVATVFALIGCGLFQLTGIFVRERVPSKAENISFKENIKIMWGNKPFRKQLISGILRSPMQMLLSIAMTLVSYYYGNYFGNYMLYIVILGGAVFGGQFVAMAFVPKLMEKYEKTKLYIGSTIMGAIPFALIFPIYKMAPQDLDKPIWLVVLFIVFGLAGAGMGALTVLQSVMIADAVDYEEYHKGFRPDGVFFSGQSFITKLSAGISSIIQGIGFSIVGFSGDNVNACNEALRAGASFKADFEPYAAMMFFLCSIPSAVGLFLSVIPMKNYGMTDSEHRLMLETLVERRNENKE